MSAEANKSIFRSYLGIWSTGELGQIDHVIDPSYIGHVAAGDRDRAGLQARIQKFRMTFPDVAFTIEDQLADGDKVVTRLSAVGTHHDTGQATQLIGINISRIAAGKIVEEWATWEALAR